MTPLCVVITVVAPEGSEGLGHAITAAIRESGSHSALVIAFSELDDDKRAALATLYTEEGLESTLRQMEEKPDG